MTGDELLTVSLPPNCDMIWLKFLLDVTLFFVTDTWILPGDAANGDAVVDDDDDLADVVIPDDEDDDDAATGLADPGPPTGEPARD